MRHRLSLCSEVMKTSGPADGHQREREREIHHLNTEVLSHITGDENTHNISWIRQTKHHNTSFTQRESCEITWRLLLNVESVYLLQWTHTHIHTLTHIQTGRHTNIFNNTQTGRHTHTHHLHTHMVSVVVFVSRRNWSVLFFWMFKSDWNAKWTTSRVTVLSTQCHLSCLVCSGWWSQMCV